MSVTRSSETSSWRKGAVAAVAVLAAATVTAGAGSGAGYAAPTVAPTSIAIRVLHSTVVAGADDTVRGQLTTPGASAAGRVVTLEARTAGVDGFTPVGTATAGADGSLSLIVQPDVDTRYRWSYAGAADAQPRMSGVALVRVHNSSHPATRLPATLSIRSSHRLVGLAGHDTIRGQLRSRGVVLPRRAVVLQEHQAGIPGWQFRSTQRTNGHGKVSFTVQPKRKTAYRLVFLGSAVFRPAHSATVRVGVRASVSITAMPTHLAPGQTETVSGTVTKAGTPLAGLTVDLLARRARAHASWHVVGTGVTAADGTISLTDIPAVDTAYRLRLHHSAGVAAALSGVRKVAVSDSTSLSIRGRDVRGKLIVTGQLLGDHHPLRGRTVILQSQAPGSTTWSQIGLDRTRKHGQVRFVEPIAAGANYRLEFVGSLRYAPSTSATLAE